MLESYKNMKYEIIIIHGNSFCIDGDSSTLQDIIENVPIWGKYVKKLECANHACKCLRNNLEQLVNNKPSYKGKEKLTKLARIRIVTAVRCAIKMRSDEKDKSEAIKKLKKDIKNSARHVLGIHDLCSTDFCKYKSTVWYHFVASC